MPGHFKPVWITALHEAAWMLFTQYRCYDLEATARGLALEIPVCRDAEHAWTLRFHCSGAEPEWPLCTGVSSPLCWSEWPSPPWHSNVWGPVINKRCDVAALLSQFGRLMPVEENTGSTHGKHVLTLPVMLKDSCLIKAASASEPALVRWCAASDIPVSYL